MANRTNSSRVKDLLENAISSRESGSCILYGNSGTSKITSVRQVLEEMEDSHDFETIRLNGLIHSNIGLSLKAIAEQLNMLDKKEIRTISVGYILDCLPINPPGIFCRML